MAYTALQQMKEYNQKRFGIECGPYQPPLFGEGNGKNDLKSAALRFLHCRCEGLKFSPEKEAEEQKTGRYLGNSILPNQIPYNMQMDLNRLCLEKALERFIDSGAAVDAYGVYYCYLEIFFGHYGKSKQMVELLSEFESNGSSLLMKHRDHYSHSVYVFALGLAIYDTNCVYRRKFKEFYHFNPDEEDKDSSAKAANFFLEYWGMASLFHDIGYPFELPFEQLMSYFEVDRKKRGKESPYLAYQNVQSITKLSDAMKERFRQLFGRDFEEIADLLAFDITKKLADQYKITEEEIKKVIQNKPVSPEQFGFFMDHAFFSACKLLQEIEEVLGVETLTEAHVDVLSAIMLHNSLFKFSVSFYKDSEKYKGALPMASHPLAYLLMLCDELQCWDRTAYGRNSRTELHPMGVEFDFSSNALSACYYFDIEEQGKIDRFEAKYKAWEESGKQGDAPRLKAYSDMAGKEKQFSADIEKIVDTTDIPLTVRPDTKKADRKSKHVFLSDSNFLHLYDFAVALHGRSLSPDTPAEKLEERFETLSLEYQISTLNRATNFGRYLNAIRCFYTDKPVDFEMVNEFTPEQAAIFAPMEHERWVREHQMMGWRYGKQYESKEVLDKLQLFSEEEKKKASKDLREQMRCHKLTMDGELTAEMIKEHYLNLDEEDQDKDWKPFNTMLELMKKFDGIRIYQLGGEVL